MEEENKNELKKSVWFRFAKVIYIGFFGLLGIYLVLAFILEKDYDVIPWLTMLTLLAFITRKAFLYIVLGKTPKS